MNKVTELFLDPKLGFIGKAKLKKKLRAKGIEVSDRELDEFYKHSEHAQVKKRIRVEGYHKITAPAHWYQIDVVKMPDRFKKSNGGVHKFFVAIEILSRKAFVYPLPSNKMQDIIAVYKRFLGDAKEVVCVQGDAEFDAGAFQRLNEAENVIVLTDVAKDDHITKYGDKLGIVDAFTKNLKGRIREYTEANDSPRFIDALDDIVANYNDTPHSSLDDHTPDEAYDYPLLKTQLRARANARNAALDEKVSGDLGVGAVVRVAVGKGVFEKEKATFSRDLYTIEERVGRRYRVRAKGGKGAPKKKLYKHYELLAVDEAQLLKTTRSGTGGNLRAAEKAGQAARRLRKEGLASTSTGVKRKPRKLRAAKKMEARAPTTPSTSLDPLE